MGKIPRRSEQGLVGFQRADDQRRVGRAKEFFDKHVTNQPPTNIVVGIHPQGDGVARQVTLAFDDGETGDIRNCTLTVHSEPEALLADTVKIIRTQIEGKRSPEALLLLTG
jgi:hypothetical protein